MNLGWGGQTGLGDALANGQGVDGRGAGGGGDRSGRRGGRRLGGKVAVTGVGGTGVGEILLESPRVLHILLPKHELFTCK